MVDGINDPFVADICTAIQVDPSITKALDRQQQRSKERVDKEEAKHRAVSREVHEVYRQTSERYANLQKVERDLSAQAGQLLSALQREEAIANKLSVCVRKNKHIRKKLLARIANPRWEIRHHYHMTCLEHALGRTQPHVLEVGEMVPGHLLLFSYARRSTLYQKALIFSFTRAKNARNAFSEKIRKVYQKLRTTRGDLKELDSLLQTIKRKGHLMQNPQELHYNTKRLRNPALMNRNNPRMRYLSKLHISPKHVAVPVKHTPAKNKCSFKSASSISPASSSPDIHDSHLADTDRASQSEEEDPDRGDTRMEMEEEWQHIRGLLKKLELQCSSKKEAKQEMLFLETCRSRIGIGLTGLPRPNFSATIETDNEENSCTFESGGNCLASRELTFNRKENLSLKDGNTDICGIGINSRGKSPIFEVDKKSTMQRKNRKSRASSRAVQHSTSFVGLSNETHDPFEAATAAEYAKACTAITATITITTTTKIKKTI